MKVRRFSEQNNLPPKAILLLDDCSAHEPKETLRSDDGLIVAMMLPPNVTAVIQPMDQNPIKITKLKYRNMLLANVVAQADDSVHDTLKNHSIKEAILLMKTAWDELPMTVLQKAWTKILNWDDKEYEDGDDIPLSELIASQSIYDELIAETQQLLTQLANGNTISIEEIEGWNNDVIDDETECDLPSEDEEEPSKGIAVPYGEVIDAVNVLIKYCANDTEHANKHMIHLLKLRSDIVQKQFAKPHKQAKLEDFFLLSDIFLNFISYAI